MGQDLHVEDTLGSLSSQFTFLSAYDLDFDHRNILVTIQMKMLEDDIRDSIDEALGEDNPYKLQRSLNRLKEHLQSLDNIHVWSPLEGSHILVTPSRKFEHDLITVRNNANYYRADRCLGWIRQNYGTEIRSLYE